MIKLIGLRVCPISERIGMSGLIPNEKIIEIQQLTNIVEVISKHVTLKRSGRNFVGLCPFHAEKTPSFSVNPEKQLYKCFGCGEGGTVFTFLMKKEGLSFPEAVRLLARQARVEIPEYSKKDFEGNNRSLLYEINSQAAEFFHRCLFSDEGKVALEYLSSRRINKDSIKKFRLGYAPEGWDSLVNLARGKGTPISRLQEAGLIIAKGDRRGFYDRFRNRLMFPITDHLGRVVGFGGRSITGSEPKYINSPETVLFNKGRCLYGADAARPHIIEKGQALIMEGYTDVIMAHQQGIPNAVGVLGTALTLEHIRQLRQWTNKVVLVMDSDTAGRKSSDRSLDILVEEEIEARVAQLPEGSDPCDFILKDGSDRFKELISSALDFFEFKVQMAAARWDLSSPLGKLAAIRDLLSTVLRVPDNLRQQLIIKNIAEMMSVEEEMLRRELGKLRPAGALKTSEGEGQPGSNFNAVYMAEKELLRLLLRHNELMGEFESEVGPETFQTEELRTIAQKAFEVYHKNGKVREADLGPFFAEGGSAKALADIALSDDLEDESVDYRERFLARIHSIKRRENRKKIGYTKERIRNLSGNQKEEEARLLREFHEKARLAHISSKRSRCLEET